MIENQDNNEITLRCKPLDPTDPTMLSCEIIPKSVRLENGAGQEASVKTPQPVQSRSGTETPSPDVSGDTGKPKYETVNVRKVQMGGKEFLEVLKPHGKPEPEAEETPLVQKTQPDISEMRHRLSRLKKCNDKRCIISKTASSRQDKTAKRNDTVGEGE